MIQAAHLHPATLGRQKIWAIRAWSTVPTRARMQVKQHKFVLLLAQSKASLSRLSVICGSLCPTPGPTPLLLLPEFRTARLWLPLAPSLTILVVY